MKKLAILLSVLFVFTSCSNQPVEFECVGNSLADIKLILQPNKAFKVEFQAFEIDEEKLNFTGEWTIKENFYELTFNQEKAPDLQALFDKNYDNGSFEVLDKRRVKFKTDSRELIIWGIPCERK
ncbi:hypothetical protein [Pontibacter harenae]|uniref:hypothetical protein n=1 Tax=Pontibacter harenae TaxID=2894083 RepID=UPI001E2F2C10|nr:hypothetical protein [Pontibacter harenae]MCC9166147.1 hypothetical protein [Pontibacter harenae]